MVGESIGSSQETLRSSVPGVVPRIHLGPTWLLCDSTRNAGSKGPGEGAAKTEQCWRELPEKLQGSQEHWAASYPRVTARCVEAALGWVGELKVGLGRGSWVGAQSSVFWILQSMENLTLNLERLQSPHPRGPAHEVRWADPPSRASTSSFGSGTTL